MLSWRESTVTVPKGESTHPRCHSQNPKHHKPTTCRVWAGRHFPTMMALGRSVALVLVCFSLPSPVESHGAVVHPFPRNGVDGLLAPWRNGVPYPVPWVEGQNKANWCPIAQNGTHANRNLSGRNGCGRRTNPRHGTRSRSFCPLFFQPATRLSLTLSVRRAQASMLLVQQRLLDRLPKVRRRDARADPRARRARLRGHGAQSLRRQLRA
jgi:hypothetical protein